MLKRSSTLIKLDLSSNEITKVGAKAISEALKFNCSLVDLSFYSYEGLHSNAIAEDGAKGLAKMLQVNKTMGFLNIGGNKIGNGGLSYLSNVIHFSQDSNLLSLNVSNNEIT